MGDPVVDAQRQYVNRAKQTGWAVVRSTDGRDWLDVGALNLLPEEARKAAAETDKHLPGWANANKVVRLAKVLIQEILP